MNILYLTNWYPDPPENGASIRSRALIDALSRDHRVALVSFRTEATPSTTAWAQRLQRVETYPQPSFRPGSGRSRLGYLSPRPRQFVDTYSPEFNELVRRVALDERPDVVVGWGLHMAPYATSLGIPYVYEMAEFLRPNEGTTTASPMHLLRSRLAWWKHRSYARRFLRQCDGCTVATEQEGEIVREIEPNIREVTLVPNGTHIPQRTFDSSRHAARIVYPGSISFRPNRDAVEWFASEILPLVRREIPDARLTVTGRNDGTSDLAGVHFTGFVDDIEQFVGESALCAVPLRQGSGTRLKILEALAVRTAVVATSKGVEGLQLEAGTEVTVADDASTFARAIVHLMREVEERAELATAGHNAVAERYAWETITPAFVDLIERAARGSRSRAAHDCR